MLIQEPVVEIVDNLWMLGTSEYPLYLVRGESDAAIFEGGVGSMGPLVLEQLQEVGVGVETIRQAVVPHAHPDHVMAVPFFRETFSGLSVIGAAAAAATLSVEKAVAFFQKIDEALTGSLLNMGRITEAHRPKPLEEKRIAVDRVVTEGDTISVDGFSFQVLHTPGHSDCSLSFHEADRGILLVSDATGYYMPAHDAFWPDYFTGYSTYLASIERLLALDAEVLCLGHHGAVKGAAAVRSHLQAAIRAAAQYHGRIVEEAQSGKPPRQIAEQLGAEVHEKTPLLPVDFFQKNCGLLVKQSLGHEGISMDK